MQIAPSVELISVDPQRHRARQYHIAECDSLFGGFALLISWGRIGRPPRVRLETFESHAELETRRLELLARRRAHGYVGTRARKASFAPEPVSLRAAG